MILHENTLISEDLFEKHFICDLNKCKGACCVEGDYGAPITADEIEILQQEFKHIEPYLTEASRKHIAEKGLWEKDKDGDTVTTCLPTGECNFSYRDEKGILKCAIERAYLDGKTTFHKPISCHLYPVRVSKVGDYMALNYHRWDICKPACKLGEKHKVSVFAFLKQPLIRLLGQKWYNDVTAIFEAYSYKK